MGSIFSGCRADQPNDDETTYQTFSETDHFSQRSHLSEHNPIYIQVDSAPVSDEMVYPDQENKTISNPYCLSV